MLEKFQLLALWFSYLACFGIYDAFVYANFNWGKKPVGNLHITAFLWRAVTAVLLLSLLGRSAWVEFDFITWVQYLLGLAAMLPLIHTGFYLQTRRFLDADLPNYWFFGDSVYKGTWLAAWLPESVKLFFIAVLEPPWWIRIMLFLLGLLMFIEPGW